MEITQTSRRAFLMSSGMAFALPMLESQAKAAKEETKVPTRLIFCGVGYGFEEDTFFPQEAGELKKLSSGLSPLERHKEDITIITNLTNVGATDPHAGSTSYLTGANVYGTSGKRFYNSISCDLVAGEHLGQKMRYSSLILDSKGKEKDGHGPGMSLAWSKDGKPVSGIKGPAALYAKLFGQGKETPEQLQTRLTKKKSILDIMNSDLKGLNKKVGKIDQDKLEEYYQSIREIEFGLKKEQEWSTKPKPDVEMQAPDEGVQGEKEIKLTYDLIALALQTNQTPVVSYRQPMSTIIKGMGMNYDPHALTHYKGSEARTAAIKKVDQKSTEILAYFIDILKKTKDIDGSSLYDNTILSWGTNIRTGHMLKNVPAIISGGGSKSIKHGRNLVLPQEDTPLGNLWLTLLQQAGVPVKSFGNSTGIIDELMS